MATITKSIGTTSRDYSTITLWEADLDDDTPYDAGDDAVGECYDDSAFDENVTINGGGTLGLNSITLTVASGERHDGTAGTGARLVQTDPNITLDLVVAVNVFAKWLEIDGQDGAAGSVVRTTINAAAFQGFHNMILHNFADTLANVRIFNIATDNNNFERQILNCIAYRADMASGTKNIWCAVITNTDSTRLIKFHNNTLYGITNGGSGTSYGLDCDDIANSLVQNNVIAGVTGSTSNAFLLTSPSNITMDHNAADDGSESGTGSISVTVSNEFVSTTGGSEDLHLKSGADCIDAGTDLGTTPTGVNIDIDGRDRDAEGDTWDIGADEFVAIVITSGIPDSSVHLGKSVMAEAFPGDNTTSVYIGKSVGTKTVRQL